MPRIKSVTFVTPAGDTRVLDLLGEVDATAAGFQMTLITGRNGSYKSTILRDLVSGLVGTGDSSRVQFADGALPRFGPPTVICVSGSTADRFPLRRISGRSTDFDVSNYHYVGQRVGPNLLSKKPLLETLLTFACQSAS